MLVEILKESTKKKAKSPRASDSCKVTYSGTLKDGTPFDSGTTSFAPNQVIKGWTEGDSFSLLRIISRTFISFPIMTKSDSAMQLMVEGDKWKLYIPWNLAYGERGSPPKIGPYAPLVFEIEIHKVESGGKPASEAREAFKKALKEKAEL